MSYPDQPRGVMLTVPAWIRVRLSTENGPVRLEHLYGQGSASVKAKEITETIQAMDTMAHINSLRKRGIPLGTQVYRLMLTLQLRMRQQLDFNDVLAGLNGLLARESWV